MAYFLLCGDIDFKILSEIMLHFSSNCDNLHTPLRYISTKQLELVLLNYIKNCDNPKFIHVSNSNKK